ncbi:2-hydroxyhepta-2,4-diene-1,7-dioate isomerase [Chitinophaga agrisoli]|uniref:2-hydroxyhepta-2,4-diene-1,7-dioate isomerase n=1 Tax=Chitinophaga agrisoli TaxID=2607653 RepID=A0A5B2VGL5_9BACT|nr:fumarylacetoacetate hydrolase family protein [Chitinophaga agrisoli]KAA2238713.1 2-hydroxyhepta-2,4-diene-1,7-dioate isomerase [Chitinophaga agrisoli]
MEYFLLYNTTDGVFAFYRDRYTHIEQDWDALVNTPHLFKHLQAAVEGQPAAKDVETAIRQHLLPPIGLQEIWAAGVTYYRSRVARMEESEDSGGATFYDLVYEAERPELFFKSTARRAVGHGHNVHIRKDSTWDVPEPELTLFINNTGAIQGYTIGNDMSSRSIEGENPLYLPQAKVYERSAAIGPCLMVPENPIASDTLIQMQIFRAGEQQYKDAVPISQMKRTHEELAEFLFRECSFPDGCYLMTGTCLVPDSGFTLQEGDVVEITIEPIGKLINTVAVKR